MTQIEKAALAKDAALPKTHTAIVTIQHSTNNHTVTPRIMRAAIALLRGPQTVPDLVKAIPCSNAPEYIRRLRHEHGIGIDCEHVPFTTIDGDKSFYGLYSLTTEGREKLQGLLASTSDE